MIPEFEIFHVVVQTFSFQIEDRVSLFALIIGVFREKDKKAYSVFNLEGERLYNDVKDFEFRNHGLYIQLEDGSWHHLDPEDGHMLD